MLTADERAEIDQVVAHLGEPQHVVTMKAFRLLAERVGLMQPRPMTLAEVKDALDKGARVRAIDEKTLSPRR